MQHVHCTSLVYIDSGISTLPQIGRLNVIKKLAKKKKKNSHFVGMFKITTTTKIRIFILILCVR